MSSVWLLPSTSTWPNKVLKGSSNYEQYLKRLYQKCHLLNFTMGPNVLEPSGHTLGSSIWREGEQSWENHLTLCLLGAVTRMNIGTSAANPLIGEVVQSRRRPLLGPSPG